MSTLQNDEHRGNTWRERWQDRRQALAERWKTTKLIAMLIWQSGPLLVLCLFLFVLLEGVVPAIQLLASKGIIDGLSGGGAQGSSSMPWAWLYAGSMVLVVLMSSLQKWVSKILSERSMLSINTMLLEAWERVPGMKLFEHTRYRNRLEALRDSAGWLPSQMITNTISFLTGLISIISILFLVASLSPLLAVALVLSTIPYARKQNQYGEMDWEYEKDAAEERRRMTYARDMLLGRRAAKEVRLFGLGAHFVQMYESIFGRLYARYTGLQRRFVKGTVLTGLLSGGVAGIGYIWVIYQIGTGAITMGDVALYLLAIFQLSKGLREVSNDGADTLELWRMGDDFRLFLEAEPDIAAPAEPVQIQRGKPMAVEFRNVTFRYERYAEDENEQEADEDEEDDEWSDDEEEEIERYEDLMDDDIGDDIEDELEEMSGEREYILENVSFRIEPGECVALVGANGSGKTTMIKLLCRFYEQTSGRIVIDGTDIEQMDIHALRSRISVVFQDYGRYGLSLEDNIRVADLGKEDADKLRMSAELAQVDSFATGLGAGYETMLGPEWGGEDLSGGQWQRLAIARSLYRDADLIIMDEPTAALDIRAEYELYQHFRRLSEGKSVLLISHRFSTVKMANRILVLKDGHIAEEGTHQQLMELGGEYAKMYSIQAESFIESA